jgi:tetratricopeptide (TPR) repeat protein
LNASNLNSRFTQIADKYQIQAELGKGGFGVVYLVFSNLAYSFYALKTFKDEFATDLEKQELFRKEANIWIKIGKHPNLVRAHFVENIGHRLYIAMEYIPKNRQGQNRLADYLYNQNLDFNTVLRWAVEFCHGMEFAYSRGIVCHRDIKPTNIMISPENTVKITDFGLAKAFDTQQEIPKSEQDPDNQQIDSGQRGYGTPLYMSPEQFKNASKCDQRSDVYSFGVVLFQLATTGKLPFIAQHPKNKSKEEMEHFYREMYRMHLLAPVPQINSPLWPIIKRCLEKNPDLRYQTFEQLRQEIEHLRKQPSEESTIRIDPDPASVREKINEALSIHNIGLQKDALKLFVQLTKDYPENAEVWSNKGLVLNGLEEFEEALIASDKALSLDPFLANAWNNKAVALKGLERYSESLICADEALKYNPYHPEAWHNKGLALANIKQFLQAISCYDQALNLNPQQDETLFSKAIALRELGKFDESLKCFEESIRLNPKHKNAIHGKGQVLLEIEQTSKAIDCFEEALKIDKNFANAWNSKGMAYYKLGLLDEALECFEIGLKIEPDSEVFNCNKGAVLKDRSRFEEALISFEKSSKKNPKNDAAWHDIGYCLQALGKNSEALVNFDIALQINPNSSIYWHNKALCHHRLDQLLKAIECYSKATDLNPNNEKTWILRGIACLKFARSQMIGDYYKEALKCFVEAIRVNADSKVAWLNKGNALCGLNQFQEGINCYLKALVIDANYADAFLNIAFAEDRRCSEIKWHVKNEKIQEIIDTYKRFLQLTTPDQQEDIEQAKARAIELETFLAYRKANE